MSQRLAAGALGEDPTYIINATSGNETFILPRGYAAGRTITIRRPDSTGNTVSIQATGGDTLNGVANGGTTLTTVTLAVFHCFEPGKWIVYGNPTSFAVA